MSKKYVYLVLFFSLWISGLIFIIFFQSTDLRGDEVSHFAIANIWSKSSFFPSLSTLKTYPQNKTPLFFWIGSIIIRCFPNPLIILRCLNFCLFMASLYLLSFCPKEDKTRFSIFRIIPLAFFPYTFGTSLFYYSDIPMLFFIILAHFFFTRKKYLPAGFSIAFAILIRQFAIFYLAGVTCYLIIKSNTWKEKSKNICFTVIPSIMLFGPLVLLWGGLAPNNSIVSIANLVYQQEPVRFKFPIYYLGCLGFYTFPLIVIFNKVKFRIPKLIYMIPVIFFIGYYLNPREPNLYFTLAGLSYKHPFFGYYDILISKTGDIISSILHGIFVVLGTIIFINCYKNRKDFYRNDEVFISSLAIIFFFLMNLRVFLCWDKYLIPMLPFLGILIDSNLQLRNPFKDLKIQKNREYLKG